MIVVVYVNNHAFPKKSKIITYEYCRHFVNHRIEFVNQIFDDIHTNGIESFWLELKNFIRQTNTKTLYFLTIARFYFLKTLLQEKKIILVRGLQQKQLEDYSKPENLLFN